MVVVGQRSVLAVLVIIMTARITSSQKGGGGTIRVLSFNMDGAQRDNTWIKYGESVRMAEDYTLCVRFNIWVFRLLTAVIYFLATQDYDEDPISFEVYFEKIRTKYGGYGRFYSLPANLATNKWYHYCQVRDVSGGEGRVYLDGDLIVREEVAFVTDTNTRDVVIGQDEYQLPYSLSGMLSQVNVWGRVLTHDEILSVSRCEVDLEGDVVTWSNQWQMEQVEEQEVPLQELCASVSRGFLTVPLPLLRFPDAVHVCRGLRGFIRVPTKREEIVKEISYFQGAEECDRQWAGVTDEAQEGVWHDPFTASSRNTSELLFRENNPDGDKYQNCIRLHVKGLEDTSCEKHSCSACHTPAGTTWTLRGICEEEKRMYYFDLVGKPLGFRGYGEYAVKEIMTGEDVIGWLWYNTITNTTMATLHNRQKDRTYPIGRLTWETKEDICEQPPGQRLLTFSSCSSTEFTCSDGSCVPFASRCDLKFDCGDKTDESFCDIVNFPDDYRSKLPPRPASDRALAISVNVTMDTLNVDTTTMMLTVSYNLRITWYDNRLTYNNLKHLTRLNTVSQEQVDQLWRPTIGFINTDDIQNTIVDSDAITTINRGDTHYLPDLSNPYEVEIYQGNTNPVSTTRKYNTVFTCFFDLILYPFDIQNCYMNFQIISASSEYLIFNLTDSFVEYLGPKMLVEYSIGTIDLDVNNASQYSVSQVRVELIRRYGYAMLNIYIPSLTLLIISYVTLLFRPSIFEVRVMTALTSLLVLATLFTQVSTSLPKTSYFKMVDIWLLFCIVLIFLIIIWHTVIDLHVEYKDGFGFGINTYTNSNKPPETWADSPSSGSVSNVTSIKVRPVSSARTLDVDKKKKLLFCGKLARVEFNLQFYIKTSKISMSVIFITFNLIYWGTLTVGSGLVYFY
ncbi:uncharacterized protein LOC121874999 [Homarus americanus]|uniref:uncharacterized protein LOC121874999 n=1 Tax=Homarus americanus TaxID=6706 RepID=UPI001C479555|nr:uncharacterized protein LOC121874999 [Homarus americanus]